MPDNQYINKHNLNHYIKNLINFKNSHPHEKENNKKEEDVISYEYERSDHYRTTRQSLNKRNKKKDKDSNKTKGNHAKGHWAYIAWEEENKSLFSSSSSCSDDECENLCLMAHRKNKDLKVYDCYPEIKPSYQQLSKVFREMHANTLDAFKQISLHRKLILEEENF